MKNNVYFLVEAFRAALNDLKANKFRSALTLFGISIGIFCMIGVLSAINSLETNINKDLSTIGNNTVFISKWEWRPTNKDYPTWLMAARPKVTLEDVVAIKQASKLTANICYTISEQSSIEKDNYTISPVNIYATEAAFMSIQSLSIAFGRNITSFEYEHATNVCVIGYQNAVQIFGNAALAINATLKIKQSEFTVVGVLKEYGRNILQGWDYDNCTILPYSSYEKKLISKRIEPFIMAQPLNNTDYNTYAPELRGILRNSRKISPGNVDNFSLNTISVFKESLNEITSYIQIGGSVIAFFSLLVGAFGIANIMYVSVKERTKIIGLKKSIGAKSSAIKFEFLIESIILCIIGGLIGLTLLALATILFSKLFGFTIVVSVSEVLTTILLCTIIGLLSGYLPANTAAKLNPVEAIRS